MALTLPYSPADIATLWPHLTPEERAEVEALVNELPIPDLTLKAFVQECWPLVEPASPFIDGWHIDVICDHLQAVSFGQIPNLIINIPPRHMKYLLANIFWVCWEWTFNSWTRWMFASYSEGLVIRDSPRCRRVINSPWYQARWGHKFSLAGDQNQKKVHRSSFSPTNPRNFVPPPHTTSSITHHNITPCRAFFPGQYPTPRPHLPHLFPASHPLP